MEKLINNDVVVGSRLSPATVIKSTVAPADVYVSIRSASLLPVPIFKFA
jgi:hypothetical protein